MFESGYVITLCIFAVEMNQLTPMCRWDITGRQSIMRKHLFLISALVLLAFSSCKKFTGEPITKDFSIDGAYTELEVDNAFDVTVSDAASLITITAGEKVMPKVIVEKVGSKLKIRLKPLATSYGSDMMVILPYNADLTSVELSGASEFHSGFGLTGEKVSVDLSGASEFHCNLNADEVDIDLSGASDYYGDIVADEIDMSLSGVSGFEGHVNATDLDLEMSGASNATMIGQVSTLKIDLSAGSTIKKTVNGTKYGFVCDQCEGFMSGASDAYIHCDGNIKVNLSGASDLHFTGNAFTSDSHTSGDSNIYHDVP